MDPSTYLLLFTLILFATILTSLGGLGAAFIIIPLLLFFEYSIELASILGLSFNLVNTLTASFRHYRMKSIEFKISLPVIIMSLVGAPTGALLVNFIPAAELKLVFSLVLILIGLNNIRKYFSKRQVSEDVDIHQNLILSLIIGFLVGFVSGLLGIGGGALVLPVLLYYGLVPKKAAGTTSFIVVFSSLVGILSKLIFNSYQMDNSLLIGGILVSILGAMLGSYAMHFKLKQSQIKLIISLLIIAVGIKMILAYF